MALHPDEAAALARLRRHPMVQGAEWREPEGELALVLPAFSATISGPPDIVARELARVVRLYGPLPGDPVAFRVLYRVRDDVHFHEAGPYGPFEIEAQRHDIATYEGISEVRVVLAVREA